MAHDFDKFPELTNTQMEFHYFDSPHTQIVRDFIATIAKVTDGDTVRLNWDERDFEFCMRLRDIDTPELGSGGEASKYHLKDLIEGKEVDILIDPENRVDKWGRLLGDVLFDGMKMSEEMIFTGHAAPFTQRREGEIPDHNLEMAVKNWL